MPLLLVAALAGCGESPRHRSDRPVLVLDGEAGDPAALEVRHVFELPEDLRAWGERWEAPRESGEAGVWAVTAWQGGGRLELALPESLGDFDGLSVRGRFRGAHRLELRLTSPEGTVVLVRNVAPESGARGEWVLTQRDGAALRASTAVLSVWGPDCEIHSLAFVDVPLALRLPGPGRERPVGLEGDVRVAVGLPPGRVLAAPLSPHPSGDTLELAVGRWPVGPGDAAPSELLLEFETPQGVVPRPFKLGAASGWRKITFPLTGMLVGSRRVLLRALGDDGAPLALADLWLGQRARSAPSVLLITSDGQRGDHLGAARGAADVRTPALDALAARGVLFEDCYAATNGDLASHAALFTGRSPRDTGIVGDIQRLAPEAFTLGEAFRAAGYLVFGVLADERLGVREGNVGQGFDRLEVAGDPAHAAAAVARLLEWVEGAGGQPLFAWVHLSEAQRAYATPRAVGGGHGDDPRRLAERYRAEVEALDAALAALFEHPRLGTGVVAFTAGHGGLLEVPGEVFGHGLPLPGTLHVPLVLAWPGAPAGRRVERPVELVDLGRTLLALADVEAPEFPGRDLTRADDAPPRPARFALGDRGTYATVTSGDEFLVLQLEEPGRAGLEPGRHACALFERHGDPGGKRDLAGERPERVRALRAALVDWLAGGEREWIDPRCACDACASGP